LDKVRGLTISTTNLDNLSTLSQAGSDVTSLERVIVREPIIEMTMEEPTIVKHDTQTIVRTVKEDAIIEKHDVAPRVETHVL